MAAHSTLEQGRNKAILVETQDVDSTPAKGMVSLPDFQLGGAVHVGFPRDTNYAMSLRFGRRMASINPKDMHLTKEFRDMHRIHEKVVYV
jgi:hypothetical protein